MYLFYHIFRKKSTPTLAALRHDYLRVLIERIGLYLAVDAPADAVSVEREKQPCALGIIEERALKGRVLTDTEARAEVSEREAQKTVYLVAMLKRGALVIKHGRRLIVARIKFTKARRTVPYRHIECAEFRALDSHAKAEFAIPRDKLARCRRAKKAERDILTGVEILLPEAQKRASNPLTATRGIGIKIAPVSNRIGVLTPAVPVARQRPVSIKCDVLGIVTLIGKRTREAQSYRVGIGYANVHLAHHLLKCRARHGRRLTRFICLENHI